MKKQVGILLVVFMLSIGLPMSVAQADMPVIDTSNLTQQIQAVAYQYQMVQTQLQNLASMNPASAAANASQIQQQLQQLQSLQSQLSGLLGNYTSLQQQWSSTYQDFNFNGTSMADYLARLNAMIQMSNNTIKDAAGVQSTVQSGIGSSASTIQDLINASQSSQGALSAAQAGNQIAAFNSQQLLQMQQLMTQMNQAQLSYMQQQQKEKEDYQNAAQQFFNVQTPSK